MKHADYLRAMLSRLTRETRKAEKRVKELEHKLDRAVDEHEAKVAERNRLLREIADEENSDKPKREQ